MRAASRSCPTYPKIPHMCDPPFRGGASAVSGGGAEGCWASLATTPARWVAFVSASPRWFAPPITFVPAGGPSAECFDRSPPRRPPLWGASKGPPKPPQRSGCPGGAVTPLDLARGDEGGPGAWLIPRSLRSALAWPSQFVVRSGRSYQSRRWAQDGEGPEMERPRVS